MDCHPTPRDLVERRELACQDGGRIEARPVRDHHPQPLGDARRMLGDQDAFGRVRGEGEQGAIESCILMQLGRGLDVNQVYRWPGGRDRLRLVLGPDVTDELDRHDILPKAPNYF